MKLTRLAPLFFLFAVAAFSQDEQQRPQQNPEDLNLDFGLDEYIYEPKFTVTMGVRQLTGAKTSFSGSGLVSSIAEIGDLTSAQARFYHDGSVAGDTRRDLSGNPLAPDGYTNNWVFSDNNQALGDGFIAMNTYSAAIQNTGTQSKDAKSSYGAEVVVSRDMGKLFGKFPWTVVFGMGINDLRTTFRSAMTAEITKTTDLYYMQNGVTAPVAPYTAPGTAVDANGNSFDTILITSTPLTRSTMVTTSTAAVVNAWKLHGAFYTLRAGPSVSFPITENLKASLSAGPVLVYSGSTYTVDQIFQPETGSEIVASVSDGVSEFLPGYYVDGSLEYTFTERAGLYLGGVYQHAGTYTQTVKSADGEYTTRVDLGSLQGVRAGMTFRF